MPEFVFTGYASHPKLHCDSLSLCHHRRFFHAATDAHGPGIVGTDWTG